MSTLVGYASSDNDEEEQSQQRLEKENGASELQHSASSGHDVEHPPDRQNISSSHSQLLGPLVAPAAQPQQNGGVMDPNEREPATTQQLLHSLTLPPIPNVSIPLSPPGSPLPSATAKVNRFLELKSKGVHFNEKLSSSTKMRNPNLLLSLMEFAGIDQNHDQYASTLLEDVAAIPKYGFPRDAYVEELGKTQQELATKRAEDRKKSGSLAFVSSGSVQGDQVPDPASGIASSRKTLSGRGSAAQRVVAGPNTSNAASPGVPGSAAQTGSSRSRKTRFDERGR